MRKGGWKSTLTTPTGSALVKYVATTGKFVTDSKLKD